MTVLDRIASDVRLRLEARQRAVPLPAMQAKAASARVPRPFIDAFAGPGVHVIAELKRRSPSLGELGPKASATETAGDYLRHGARALSVLTEEDHFHGSKDDLALVREHFPDARLLQKDFVLEPYQLFEARALGADAVLLIVALLGERTSADLLALSRELELEALVEVHDEAELATAQAIGARLIGVNNRNLKTLEISLETSARLAPLAKGATLICESGLSTGAQVKAMRALGFSGFLIGSAFMKTPRPGQALGQLLEESR